MVDESVADEGGGESKLFLQPHGLEGVAHVRGTGVEGNRLDPGALDTAENVRSPMGRAE